MWVLTATLSIVSLLRATPDAQPACDRNAPLTRDNIYQLVEVGVPGPVLQSAIAACGINFPLDDAFLQRLRQLGAPAQLIDLLWPASSARAWVSPIDGATMVLVGRGEVQIGSPENEAGRKDDEAPHTVRNEPFWIDANEVTNAAYRRFVLVNAAWQKDRIARPFHDGNYLSDWNGNDFPSGKGDFPVAWVSWPAASAFARWTGRRLPTEAEWEIAARAGTRTPYWWGAAFDPARVAPFGRTSGNAGLVSPNGTVAMLGGVWEWTSSLYRAYPYTANDGREDPDATGRRVKRGGAWNSGARFLRAANRSSESPEITSSELGFRCVR